MTDQPTFREALAVWARIGVLSGVAGSCHHEHADVVFVDEEEREGGGLRVLTAAGSSSSSSQEGGFLTSAVCSRYRIVYWYLHRPALPLPGKQDVHP